MNIPFKAGCVVHFQGRRIVDDEPDTKHNQNLPTLLHYIVLASNSSLNAEYEVCEGPKHHAIRNVRPLYSGQDGCDKESSSEGGNKYLLNVFGLKYMCESILLEHFLIRTSFLEQNKGQ